MNKYENPWFLLYDGDSPDGRGAPDYIGRTCSAQVAYKHYRKVSKNPYSTGCVILITDTQKVRICLTADVEWLRREAGDE